MRRTVLTMIITALMIMVTSPLAAAAPWGGCDPELTVTSSTSGPANMIDSTEQGRPSATHSDDTATLYERYGYGGLVWPMFDCETGPSIDAGAAASGAIANVMFTGLAVLIAGVSWVSRKALEPDTIGVLDPVVTMGTNATGNGVFMSLFWITLALTGLVVLWRAMRARFVDSARGVGWALMVGMLALFAMAWPLTLAPLVDGVITGTVNAVNHEMAQHGESGDLSASDGAASNLHRSLLFETWCSGMVGGSAEDGVRSYCVPLYEAATIGHGEEADSGDAEDEFKDVLDELEDEHPAAYEYLTSEPNGDRIWYAALGWFGLFAATPFLLVASLLLLYALVVIRLAIIALPAVAVIGAFPPLRRYAVGLFDYVAGAVITALIFGSLAAVFVGMLSAFMRPTVHPLLAMVLLAICTVAAWKLTKPFRRVKHMSTMRDRFGGRSQTDGDVQNPSRYDEDSPKRPRDPSGGGIFGTDGIRERQYRNATPAEASPSVVGSAAKGAAVGAVSTAALGVASGGVVTGAAMAAGAAKGAAVAAGGAKYGTAGALIAAGATRNLGSGQSNDQQQTPATEAAEFNTAPTVAANPGPRPAGALPAAPAQDPKPRVYTPGEATSADPVLVEPDTSNDGEKVYPIYTPEPKGAEK